MRLRSCNRSCGSPGRRASTITSLRWDGTGGPTVEPPFSEGYGTRVIGASIERQLGGNVSFDWRFEGLHCVLALPRAAEMPSALQVPDQVIDKDSVPPAKVVAGRV